MKIIVQEIINDLFDLFLFCYDVILNLILMMFIHQYLENYELQFKVFPSFRFIIGLG